jgi:hypothetical protein
MGCTLYPWLRIPAKDCQALQALPCRRRAIPPSWIETLREAKERGEFIEDPRHPAASFITPVALTAELYQLNGNSRLMTFAKAGLDGVFPVVLDTAQDALLQIDTMMRKRNDVDLALILEMLLGERAWAIGNIIAVLKRLRRVHNRQLTAGELTQFLKEDKEDYHWILDALARSADDTKVKRVDVVGTWLAFVLAYKRTLGPERQMVVEYFSFLRSNGRGSVRGDDGDEAMRNLAKRLLCRSVSNGGAGIVTAARWTAWALENALKGKEPKDVRIRKGKPKDLRFYP